MVPGKRFDKPGKSPFMDMMLVPRIRGRRYRHRQGHRQPARPAEPRRAHRRGHRRRAAPAGVGGRAASRSTSATRRVMQARATGYVERLHVRATLDRVAKGQPLVDLYVPDWVAAQEEFLALQARRRRRCRAAGRGARQRMRLVGMSDEQIARVESSDAARPRFTLTAPIGGVVAELAVREGMTVSPGAMLARINGLSTVWADAEVPESQAALVRPGTKVEARTPGGAGHGVSRRGAGDVARGERRDAHAEGARRARQPGHAPVARHVRHDAVHGHARREGDARADRSADPDRQAHGRDAGRGRRQVHAGRCRGRHRIGRADRDQARPEAGPARRRVVAVPDRFGGEPERRRGAAEQRRHGPPPAASGAKP